MIPTPSGEFNKRVTWQKRNLSNVKGTPKSEWEAVGEFWAKVIPVSDGESITNNHVESKRMYDITMRYVGDISTNDRLIYKSKTLNIASVINVEDEDVEYKLTCVEVHG